MSKTCIYLIAEGTDVNGRNNTGMIHLMYSDW